MNENETEVQMPRYRCHKEVWALKINSITHFSDGSALITPSDVGYDSFPVDTDYVKKTQPASRRLFRCVPGRIHVFFAGGSFRVRVHPNLKPAQNPR